MGQLDMFGATDESAISDVSPPISQRSGGWTSPDSEVFSAALKRGSLRDALATLNRLSAKAACQVLLDAGFGITNFGNRAKMMRDVQGDLVVAAQSRSTGWEVRGSRGSLFAESDTGIAQTAHAAAVLEGATLSFAPSNERFAVEIKHDVKDKDWSRLSVHALKPDSLDGSGYARKYAIDNQSNPDMVAWRIVAIDAADIGDRHSAILRVVQEQKSRAFQNSGVEQSAAQVAAPAIKAPSVEPYSQHSPMSEAKVLYRSVSPEEWEHIQANKTITGGLNSFNPFDPRREVFFADTLNGMLLNQGEDITRRSDYQLMDTPLNLRFKDASRSLKEAEAALNLEVKRHGYDSEETTPAFVFINNKPIRDLKISKKAIENTIDDLKGAYSIASNDKRAELRAADAVRGFSSVILETKPILVAGGKVYSNTPGNSGMGNMVEYGLPSGAVSLSDVARVHKVRNKEIIGVESLLVQDQAEPAKAPVQAAAAVNDAAALAAFQERTDTRNDLTALLVDQISAKLLAGELPVFQKDGLTVSISNSARQAGMFQVTRFNESGALGDSQYRSVEEAIRSEGLRGFALLSALDAEKVMASFVEAEAGFQEGPGRVADGSLAFPRSAEGAIAAFNSDNSKEAVAIMAKLKIDALQVVGSAVGFRPQIHENATAFRERIGSVADRLTLSSRTVAARENALYQKCGDLAREYTDIKGHSERAIGNGITDPESTAFMTFTPAPERKQIKIAERMPMLVDELQALQSEPDYAKISAVVRNARPAIFDALDALEKPLTSVANERVATDRLESQAQIAKEDAAKSVAPDVAPTPTPAPALASVAMPAPPAPKSDKDVIVERFVAAALELGISPERSRFAGEGCFQSMVRTSQKHNAESDRDLRKCGLPVPKRLAPDVELVDWLGSLQGETQDATIKNNVRPYIGLYSNDVGVDADVPAAVLSVAHALDVEPVDPNIGLSWKSKDGVKTIVEVSHKEKPEYGMDRMYKVTLDSNADVSYSVYLKDIDRTRNYDEYHASPEGQLETAKKQAEHAAAQERAEAFKAAAKAKSDAIEARIDSSISADDYSALERGKIKTTLMVVSSGDGVSMSRAEWVEKWMDEGAKVGSREENKIQALSSRAFMRADNFEQAAHEKKIRDAGTKTVYSIGEYVVSKSEYLYAQAILECKDIAKEAAAEAEVASKHLAAEDSLRKGESSFQDYMDVVGLTDDDIGLLSNNSLRNQADSLAKANSPYHAGIAKIGAAIHSLSEGFEKGSTPQSRKAYEEKSTKYENASQTLRVIENNYLHPFQNNLMSKLPIVLQHRLGKQWDSIECGMAAKTDFVNKSYETYVDLIIAAGREKVLDNEKAVDALFSTSPSVQYVGADSVGGTSLAAPAASLENKVAPSGCVQEGNFSGRILDVAGGVVVQRINRVNTVLHDVSKLSASVKEGDVVDIKYKDGVGVVVELDKNKGQGR